MAGEILIRTFHRARYDTLRPVLEQFVKARRLDEEALAAVRHALTAPLPRHLARLPHPREVLERILASPTRDLRDILGRREIAAARGQAFDAACFEAGGDWTLMEPGPSWVVLDGSMRALYDVPWFYDVFFHDERRHALVDDGTGPAEESADALLEADDLQSLSRHVPEYLARLAPDDWDRVEVGGLATLLTRIAAMPGWTLVYQSML